MHERCRSTHFAPFRHGWFVWGVFKKEKRAKRYSIEEKIQWYIRDKAVPVQSNTAQRDVNVPLEEKLAETGLDSPPPSLFKPL